MGSSAKKSDPSQVQNETDGTALPPLTDREFKLYNRLAEKMDYFHEHFRATWKTLYDACKANKRPRDMSLRAFIQEGLSFCEHLTAHHNIEETYFFPLLARKMPEFRITGPDGRKNAALLRQHEQIHAGMDLFEEYLRGCLAGETELDLRTMKAKMDTFGDVLWAHLDDEVRTLGAENMRKFWTLDEIRSIPI